MSFRLRPMRREDLDQVVEIDKEAFPTQWPPTNYRNELQNRLAHYAVVYLDNQPVKTTIFPQSHGLLFGLRKFLGFERKLEPVTRAVDHIVGFAGCWIMADETHITEIAVRQPYRRQGIGQLLIITLVEIGIEKRATLATLEVRVSNLAAQKLYEKLGFANVGQRKGYYNDNREDAIIMTAGDIKSLAFQATLEQHKQALMRRWKLSDFPVLQK